MTPEQKAREKAEAAWNIWAVDLNLCNQPNERIAARITERVTQALLDARREARLETIEECAELANYRVKQFHKMYSETRDEHRNSNAVGAIIVRDDIRALAKAGDE